MDSVKIYNDVCSILDEITHRIGVNFFQIGLVTDIMYLPKKTPKLYVWFFNSGNESNSVFKKLHEKYGIEFNEGTIGQYLYAHEIRHLNI